VINSNVKLKYKGINSFNRSDILFWFATLRFSELIGSELITQAYMNFITHDTLDGDTFNNITILGHLIIAYRFDAFAGYLNICM